MYVASAKFVGFFSSQCLVIVLRVRLREVNVVCLGLINK